MSSIRLPTSKRRKGQHSGFIPSLPVPTADHTGEAPAINNWNYFTGDLISDHVLVRHSGDIDTLYNMGFFGKGNMSRNKPEYNEDSWPFRKRKKYGFGDNMSEQRRLRVLSKRQYLSHLAWKEQHLSPTELSTSLKSRNQCLARKPSTNAFTHESGQSLPQANACPDIIGPLATEANITTMVTTETATLETEGVVKVEENHSEESLHIESGLALASKDAPDWTDTKKEDPDPWLASNQTEGNDFWNMQPSVGINNSNVSAASPGPSIDGSKQLKHLEPKKVFSTSDAKEPINYSDYSEQLTTDTNVVTERIINDVPKSCHRGKRIVGGAENWESHSQQSITSYSQHISCPGKRSTETDINLKSNEHAKGSDRCVGLDALCVNEDRNGSLQVVDDTDESNSESEEVTRKSKEDLKWIPTQKLDPYPLKECLQLTFEEAFFLSYGLGCLVVLDEKQEPMDLSEMWQLFCVRRPNFIYSYVAYHSLRSRGWVPKTGIKYGVDFVLYHKGPPYYHGTYSVLVRTAREPDLCDDLDPANAVLSWTSLMGTDRVTENVAKEPLLVLVIRPRDLTDAEMTSPSCLRRFKVQEILLSRWIPSKERETAEVAEWM